MSYRHLKRKDLIYLQIGPFGDVSHIVTYQMYPFIGLHENHGVGFSDHF